MNKRRNIINVAEVRAFLLEAYGIKSREVNEYHLQLYQEEYVGHFDWYHTTGTLIANRNGGTTSLGKIKNEEEVAQIINKHIYGSKGFVPRV